MKMSEYRRQGKSENYQDAEEKGRLKAGEVAALLSKKFNTKIYAKDLSAFAKEWHHGGVFKSANGASVQGKRIYFFKPADVEKITLEQIMQQREKVALKPAPDHSLVQGWYVQFFKMTDPKSRKTYAKPFIGIYKGPASKAPKGFKPLDDVAFANAEAKRGRELKPGEQPVF